MTNDADKKTPMRFANNELFRDNLTEEKLNLLIEGHAGFQCLWAGVELGLYNLLSKVRGLTRTEIAEGLNLQERAVRVLVTGLVSVGVLLKEGDTYSLSAWADRCLVEGRPEYLGDTMAWQRYIVYPGLEDFAGALRANRNIGLEKFPGQGDSLYARLRSDPFKERVFARAMEGLSRQANEALLESYDFSRFKHLVDIGGGNGTNAMAFARHYPRLKATIMDLPSVCELARQNLEHHGLLSRVSLHPGNVLEDPFPQGPDLILFCHLFSIWDEATDQRLMKKAYDALPAGGALALFGMAMDADDKGPVSTALGNPYFLAIATGTGYLYSLGEYEEWMRKVGFRKLHTVTGLPVDHILIVAEK
jgi:ubiquinone/menaquinone biosynthesis C-methylase UbiE